VDTLPDVGAVIYIVYELLSFFLILMLIRLVVDWVQVFARSWTPRGPVLFVLEIVYTITDPPIMFVRRFVPPLRLGAVSLDTSFLIVLVVVYLLQRLLTSIPV
jgi:YggT family protein